MAHQITDEPVYSRYYPHPCVGIPCDRCGEKDCESRMQPDDKGRIICGVCRWKTDSAA